MTKKILLLGANERACFSVAKNLTRHGYHVDVAHWGHHPVAFSRFVNDFYALPAIESDLRSFFTAFIQVIRKNSYWLVLPVNDIAVEFLNYYQKELAEYSIIGGINPGSTIRFSQNKYELLMLCKEFGINTPSTVLVGSLEEFSHIKSTLQYPLIAKPVSSRKIVGNKIYGFAVRKFSKEEPLEDFIRERILSTPVMLQQVVNGFGIGFNFLAKKGKLLAYYMHERINEPGGGGESSYRKTIIEDKYEIAERSKQLIERICWDGVGMIEYKVQEGQAYIMELNGRFWGSIELGIFSGIEIPYWLVLYNYENEGLPGEIISCRKEVYARNFRNDLVNVLKKRSLKELFKWIGSVPKAFRFSERVEDSLFVDFRFRFIMWWNLPAKALSGRWQSFKRRFISLKKNGHPNYKMYKRILFVCEGNICRSPFAEKYLQKKKPALSVASAGLQHQSSKMSPLNAIKAAGEFGIDLSSHQSSFAGDIDTGEFDVLFVMDKENYQKLSHRYPGVIDKIFFLDQKKPVRDPFGGSPADFENCYQRMKDILDQNFSF